MKAGRLPRRLRYGSDQAPGIRRVRNGKGFSYVSARGRKVGTRHRYRIQELRIPPAWEKVWISPDADSHLQATGYDSKNRKQYLYHVRWSETRNETKFHRLARFGRVLPKIRRCVNRDLRRRGLPREKVIAAVVRLLEQTRIRIGNPQYAKENNSFGLSTMRNKHVTVKGECINFKFRGKSGKFHEISLPDERLAKIVRRCQDLPGHQLFEYYDEAGEIHNVTSTDVNAYLHAIAGEDFSAKDFRTWTATAMAARLLKRFERAKETPDQPALIAVIDEVADALGNTRAICRKYYIHPAILDSATKPKKARFRLIKQKAGFTILECQLLGFLEHLSPS